MNLMLSCAIFKRKLRLTYVRWSKFTQPNHRFGRSLKGDFKMIDQNCAYCMEGELVAKFGIKICELETSKVYLFKEQSHKGRVIVAHKNHIGDMTVLTAEERAAYFEDVTKVSKALQAAFNPNKVNYGAYGDTGCHLHFHLVPKYSSDEFEWGSTFAMNPERVTLTDAEYAEIINQIKANL